MTDNEMLNLILEKVSNLETDMKTVNSRLDKMDSKLEMLEVWQKKTSDQVAELQVAQKLFELSTNKKLARLQDGMDTIEEILKLNEMIPR